MIDTKNETAILSIGGLARSSGIPVETLRNWEKRYGFPSPERLESGHRRYSLELVKRLRLIREVTELGYKSSFAVLAPIAELENLVNDTKLRNLNESESALFSFNEQDIKNLFMSAEAMDTRDMDLHLRRAWSKYGAYRFITQLAVPFMREVGEKWFKGRQTVAHEHFASESLQSFLAAMWRPLSERSNGIKTVLANFSGELHCLGLHMAAVLLTLHDIEVLFLGANTPTEDIVAAANDPKVFAVVIGLSLASDMTHVMGELKRLRALLQTEILVAVGGNESIPTIDGIIRIPDFETFESWAATLSQLALSK